MTLSSPSARAREKVRGGWTYEIDPNSGKERLLHLSKQLIGSLIPVLTFLLPINLVMSRAGTESISWLIGILTCLYIAIDSFSSKKEFEFFRLGPDLSLAAILLSGVLSLVFSLTTSNQELSEVLVAGLGPIRWIPLLYLFTYMWDLFPGINRVMLILLGSSAVAVALSWVQLFQGVDWFSGEDLVSIPGGNLPYHVPRGFVGSPEALATLFACLLPFPLAAACLRFGRGKTDRATWFGFALSLLMSLGLFFTFRPGLWWAGLTGGLSLLLFPGERRFKIFSATAGLIIIIGSLLLIIPDGNISSTYESVSSALEKEDLIRAENHRSQMSRLVDLWEKNPILGTSANGETGSENAINQVQTESVNVYFYILARGGVLGLVSYLAFVLHHLLSTLRLFNEIPESHRYHRIIAAGCFASQCAFHVAGLFWGTLLEAFSMNLFILISSIVFYMNQNYSHQIVPDDWAL